MPDIFGSNKGCAAGWLRGCVWFAFVLILLGTTPAGAQAQVSETVLHNFDLGGKGGVTPGSALYRDSAGNLYGTTADGGAFGHGVVYKVDTTGHESVLHNFTGGPDGDALFGNAGVVGDPAGNLYGTTQRGGAAGYGVVFKIDAVGNYTVLHTFSNGEDGGYPGSVILDPAGNFYGPASSGGTNNNGVVFKVDAAGHFMVLHHFTGGTALSNPFSVAMDAAGTLYGIAGGGLACGCGGTYRLDPTGNYKVLYRFTRPADSFAVVPDSEGNLYGTQYGGKTGCDRGEAHGCGAVYKLDVAGNYSVLHTFTRTDGGLPSGLTIDGAGNLYGTTFFGGDLSACGGDGCGSVFKLDAAGSFTVLHTFTGRDGNEPEAGVIRDAAGNLYGTTLEGGPAGLDGGGVTFKLDPTGQETVLFSFKTAAPRGNDPAGGITGDSAGNLYGTTYAGGAGDCFGYGCGVIYKMDSNAQYTVLHTFTGGADGGQPNGVLRDSAGNLYGTTQLGGIVSPGVGGSGVVYRLDPEGNYVVLHTFPGGTDGGAPGAGVVRDSAGNLYGTTGGAAGNGYFNARLVYKLDPAGNYTVLYKFANGDVPSGVILDPAGNLYGTNYTPGSSGVIYKLDALGNYSALHTFNGTDGAYPNGVTRDAAGNLYGTTSGGGAVGYGVVFKLDAAGNYTVLYNFTDYGSGSGAGVVLDPAGNLYGISGELYGLVYKLDTGGNFSVLYSFTGGGDGRDPSALLYGPGGNLVGTTAAGGKSSSGVVFALTGLP